MSAVADLERFMHANIPLAAATGARLTGYDGRRLDLAAPLAPNSNHHGTAFGGSLYVVALAAGWGLTHLLVTGAELNAAIYIQHGEADYRRPVTQDLQARATAMDDNDAPRFLATLERERKARLAVIVTIGDPDAPAFLLHARFAARLADPA